MVETIQALDDNVKLSAAWGLSLDPDAGAVPVLVIALQSADSDARIKALEGLGATSSPRQFRLCFGL